MANKSWKGIRDLFGPRQEPADRGGATPADLVQFAGELGYSVVRGPDGKFIPVPIDLPAKDLPSVLGNWDALYDAQFHSYENREKRLKSYQMMDASGAEGAVVLDTYADEIVNVVDNSDTTVQVEFSDKEIGKKVMAVLRRNGVLGNLRQDIRSLCKYGDFAYAIVPRRGQELVKIPQTEAEAGVKIDRPLRPEDLHLQHVRSTQYEFAGYHNRVFKMKVSRDVLGGFQFDEDEFMPWEFAPFIISDRDTFPYGMSVLEKCRVPYEQLVILEKLLAVSRANSVDRIAVMVPGTGGDPTTQMNRLSQIKNSLKTILQIGASSRMTRNQDVGMTEWLFVPKDFEVKKLATSIPLGSPDDVTYFRDKYHNATRLPKGFFISSEANGAQRPLSLRQQDIKFARALIPVSEAYCNGLRNLCVLLAFYLGADIGKFDVKVAMKNSAYVSEDLLAMYKNAMELVDTFVTIRTNVEPDYKPTKADIMSVLHAVDAPATLLFPDQRETEWAGNRSTSSPLYETAAAGGFESLFEFVVAAQGANGYTTRAA
jgi:hypothetical protein